MRSLSLRAQSYKTLPPPHPQFQTPVGSPKFYMYLWPTGYKLLRSHDPPSRLIICQKNSQNSGKVYFLGYQLIIKDTTQDQPDGRNARGKVCGKVLARALQACYPPSGFMRALTLEAFWTPSDKAFHGGFITQAWLVTILAISNWLNSQNFSPSWRLGGEKLNAPVLWWHGPLSWWPTSI